MGLFTFRRRQRRLAAEQLAREALGHGEATGEAGDTGANTGGTSGAGSTGNGGDAGTGADTAGGTGTGSAGTNTGADAGTVAGADAKTGDTGTPGNTPGEGIEPNSTPKLTEAEYAEVMRNKSNVMAELKRLGVEFSDRTGADDLREQLNAELATRGMLP